MARVLRTKYAEVKTTVVTTSDARAPTAAWTGQTVKMWTFLVGVKSLKRVMVATLSRWTHVLPERLVRGQNLSFEGNVCPQATGYRVPLVLGRRIVQ